jgi:hypothetical protein
MPNYDWIKPEDKKSVPKQGLKFPPNEWSDPGFYQAGRGHKAIARKWSGLIVRKMLRREKLAEFLANPPPGWVFDWDTEERNHDNWFCYAAGHETVGAGAADPPWVLITAAEPRLRMEEDTEYPRYRVPFFHRVKLIPDANYSSLTLLLADKNI